MKRAERALEHLDGPVAAADREASLADVDRLNAWFGGYWLTLRAIARVLRQRRASGPLVIVDIGGGRGHFGRRLVAWAGRRGVNARVVVIDREAMVADARALVVRADATALPLRAGAADVVTTALTLHHLERAAAVRCQIGRASCRERVWRAGSVGLVWEDYAP